MSQCIELRMALHGSLARAVIVSETGEESRSVVLPLSQVDVGQTGKTTVGRDRRGQTVNLPLVDVVIPEWLAKERGLI